MPLSFVKLGDVPCFKIKNFESKSYKAWDTVNYKWITSDVPAKGLSPRYKFLITVMTDSAEADHLIELSSDQLGQCLIGAFDYKKPLTQMTYSVKTNGKQGKETRYWINPLRMPQSQPYAQDTPKPSQTPINANSGLTDSIKDDGLDHINF